MLAIVMNALYTTSRKRGTTRQLARAIVACVFSALLLLPALAWYNVRFSAAQAAISVAEVMLALVYVALWGWLVPWSVTTSYCLFTQPRDSNTSARLARHRNKRTTRGNAALGDAARRKLPRRQAGMTAPFVFGEDTAWGWLEHRGGRFQGQKLALKRAAIGIGREEDNDIWLDDETASRYHAELAWDQGQAYITDCDSLNGVLLNGRRIRGTLPIKNGDLLEIGAHRFRFEMAERPDLPAEQLDPLGPLLYRRRPSLAAESGAADELASSRKPASANALPTKPLDREAAFGAGGEAAGSTSTHTFQLPRSTPGEIHAQAGALPAWHEGMRSDPITPPPLPGSPASLCVICNGEMAGRSFLLDRPMLTVGSSAESDVVIDDPSISWQHVRFSRQADGDYIEGLASESGTKVNDELLLAPRLLHKGDIVSIGTIRLEYTLVPEAQTTPMPPLPTPPLSRPLSGPVPLRLPSKPK